jgi:VanZ family protein
MNFVAINWFTRFFYLLSLFVVYLIQVPILYFYILVLFINVEILLSHKSKSETNIFKISQLIFIVFVSYVLFARADIWGFSDETYYNLNSLEHILFAIVISLLIYYYILFFDQKKKLNPIILSVFLFNSIGLINEFFQSYFQGKSVFFLDEFSIKDLIVNVIGSAFFILIIRFLKTRISVLSSIEK